MTARKSVSDSATVSPNSTQSVVVVPIANIASSPFQPRKHFDEAGIRELADSIEKTGLIQPITVRLLNGGDTVSYELIAGERRLRAHKLLGRMDVHAIIMDVDEEGARSMTLIENLQREDLTLVEEANCLQELVRQFGDSLQTAADKIGKSIMYVNDRVSILGLPSQVQTLLDEKKLNLAQAKVLLKIEGEENRVKYANAAVKLGLTASQLEARSQRSFKVSSPSGEGDRTTFEQVSRNIVRLYDALNQFDYSMLHDPKKAVVLLKQIALLEKALLESKAKLESEQHE